MSYYILITTRIEKNTQKRSKIIRIGANLYWLALFFAIYDIIYTRKKAILWKKY